MTDRPGPAEPSARISRRFAVSLAATAVAIIAALLIATTPPTAPFELIFTGGDILTMDGSRPSAEALLVRGGRIVAIGDTAGVLGAAGADAVRVDLKGRTLMPGLIEVHTHPLAAALLAATVDVSGFTHDSRLEILRTLRTAAAGFSWTPWTLAFGWDPVMVDDLEPPTLAELDEIAPDKPMVVLTQMMHDAYLNSAALRAAGIERDTPDPIGGEFVRDASGALTGTVREVPAIERVLSSAPKAPTGVTELLLSLQYGRYARAGYTTLGVLGAVGRVDDPVGTIAALSANPRVPVRTIVYRRAADFDAGAPTEPAENDRFRLRGVKLWIDGSPFAGGAATAEPYRDTALSRTRLGLAAGHRGALNYEDDELERTFERYHTEGRALAFHVQGERAVDQVLDVAERVLARSPPADSRHRLEHNALITEAQMQRALGLGFTLSFFVDHVYFYGHRLPELFGVERTARYMPLGSARRLGHRATIHTDNPATPIAPFRAVRTAVLRTPARGGTPVAPKEAVSVAEALRAVTVDAAWQLGLDDEVGSLAPGKAADLVILSRNPLQTAPEKLTDIEVVQTYLAGMPVDARPWTRTNLSLAFGAALDMARGRANGER